MSKTAWQVLSAAVFVLFLAVAVAGFAIGGCTKQLELVSGGVCYMKCYYAIPAAGWVALVGAVGAISAFLCVAQGANARRASVLPMLAAAVVCIILPTNFGIGICSHEGSACYLPALIIWVACAAVAILTIAMLVAAAKFDSPENNSNGGEGGEGGAACGGAGAGEPGDSPSPSPSPSPVKPKMKL